MTNTSEISINMQNCTSEEFPSGDFVNEVTINESLGGNSSSLENDSLISSNCCNKRRGEYGFYPPNLRIRIAKMALEKGVSKTADHFSDDLGRYVSPSTVASIRNQYLKEVSQCIEENVVQISELPKAETGRPLILEELDLHILQCAEKIKESGGAINAAVIKRIARDIIVANNKSLLLEYGGPFELSNAWAERTLKRITDTNGKKQRTNKNDNTEETSRSPSPGLEEMKRAYVDIITSAVKTHGLSKELIPSVVPVGFKQQYSQRDNSRISLVNSEMDLQSDSLSDIESKSQENEADLQENITRSHPAKYKSMACSSMKGKQSSRKKFRILKVPARNSARVKVMNNSKLSHQNKSTFSPDSSTSEIPEKELIEMAIPCASGKRKRGDYATYTSEQRICMAKMALEIGVAKTAQHFTAEFGRYVSPSSVASMRNQYRKEVEKSRNEVMELPKGRRGRPLLLGHLDSEIKRAIESIKSTGGKIGRSVIKSVAKDIILVNNRNLLKEYGGPLQLTNTWAESVMKRMGFVRQRKSKNSKADSMAKTTSKNSRNLSSELEELNEDYMDVINNVVNGVTSTHGLADELMSNYDHYPPSLPANHIGSHNLVQPLHIGQQNSFPSSQSNFHVDPLLNRNSQTEQETLGNLSHLRQSVENYPISYNHNNLYYSGWSGHSNRDLSLIGSFGQQSSSLGIYNSHVDPPLENHQQEGLKHHLMSSSVRSDTVAMNNLTDNSFQPSIQQSIDQACSRNSTRDLVSCENINSTLSSHVEDSNSSNIPAIEPLLTPEISLPEEHSGNSVQEPFSVQSDLLSDERSLHSRNPFDLECSSEKETLIITSRTEGIENGCSSRENAEKQSKNKPTKNKNSGDTKRKRGLYGVYTAEQRMKMAKLALEYGVTKAANMISEEMDRVVSSSTVASMRNLYLRELEKSSEEINELPKGKRGRPLLLGDLDSQIQRCLMNIRINGGVITRMVVVSVARGIILAKNKSLLKEYGGPVELSTTWAESVIRRMGFVRQKTDGSECVLPPDFENLKSAFLKRITSTVMTNSIPKDLILSFGQSSLKIVPSSSWTTEGPSYQQIPNLEIEDRREITSVLTVSLAGNLLPIQLIYTGKTEQCHPNIPFPNGWNVTHSENHLCTSETMIQFAEKLLIPYVIQTRVMLGLSSSQKALVIFDVSNMNQDKEFFTKLRENYIEVVLVPTPCTSSLHPLELTVFGRFRDELYKFFVNWYSAEVCEAVRAGQNPSTVMVDLRLSVLKHLHAQWILKTHEILSGQRGVILEGFGKAGIIEALTSSVQKNN